METYLTERFIKTYELLPEEAKKLIASFKESLEKLEESLVRRKYTDPNVVVSGEMDGMNLLVIKNYRIYCSFYEREDKVRVLILSGIYHASKFRSKKKIVSTGFNTNLNSNLNSGLG